MVSSDEALAGHVIVAVGKLERMLKEAGATAAGIHDSVSEIEDKLSPDCVKKLRYIASVRNKLAHGEALSEPLDLTVFDASCEAVAEELKRCSGKKHRRKIESMQENMIDELDREFRLSVKKRLRLCGMIPVLNIVYFCALCVKAFHNAVQPLVLLIFSFIAIPVLIESCRSGNRLYLFIGGMFFILYWALTLIYGFSKRTEYPQITKFWYVMPLISIIYLCRVIGKVTEWGGFLCGFIPLCVYGIGVLLWQHNNNIKGVLIAVGVIWLAGMLLVGLRKRRSF